MKKEIKTYIEKIDHAGKRQDSLTLVKLLEEASGYKAKLCGKIIAFGLYHYKYESGREGEAIVTGFSPGKQKFSIYIMPGFDSFEKELSKLGKHKVAKCCLYINKLADVDEKVLKTIVKKSVAIMQKRYECRKT